MTEAVSGRIVVTARPNGAQLKPVWHGARGLAATLLDSCRLELWPPYRGSQGTDHRLRGMIVRPRHEHVPDISELNYLSVGSMLGDPLGQGRLPISILVCAVHHKMLFAPVEVNDFYDQ